MSSDVPADWTMVRYGDAARVNAQSLPSSTPPDQLLLYLDISSVTGPGTVQDPVEVSFGDAPSRARRVVRSKDTLVSTVRPYLRSFAFIDEASENLVASTGFAVLSAKPDVDARYLYQTVLSDTFLRFLEDRMTGSNYPAVNASDVAVAPLPLPPLPEQQKIAAILSSVDEAIQATQAVIEQTRRVKEGLLQDLLTKGIGHARFRNTALGDLPATWEVMPLTEVCTGVIDCPHTTPNYSNHGHPCVRTPNVRGGQLVSKDLRMVDDAEYASRTSRAVPLPGDVIFTREAPAGEAFLIPEGMKPCLGQRTMLLRPAPDRLIGGFLVAALYSPAMQSLIEIETGGSTVGHLNVKAVRRLPVPIPPLDEQRLILEHIEAVDGAERGSVNELATLLRTKAGLLQDLLTGKVRVSV